MSNPYLTMYGDTLEHAWGSKAKEKEYNHQYYLRNRERLLARQRAMYNAGGARNTAYTGLAQKKRAVEAQIPVREKVADYKRAVAVNKTVTPIANAAVDAVNLMTPTGIVSAVNQGNAFVRRKAQNYARGIADASAANKDAEQAENKLRALERADENYARRMRAARTAHNYAKNAYEEEQRRIRTGLRSNARAEAAEKIAANNTVGAKIQRGARAAAYKVAGTAERAARRATRAIKNSAVGKKAAEIADRAKKAFEQAKLKFRAAKGAGSDVSGKLRAAYDRAKELYQKAKGKVNQYLNPNFVGPKKR